MCVVQLCVHMCGLLMRFHINTAWHSDSSTMTLSVRRGNDGESGETLPDIVLRHGACMRADTHKCTVSIRIAFIIWITIPALTAINMPLAKANFSSLESRVLATSRRGQICSGRSCVHALQMCFIHAFTITQISEFMQLT